MWQPLGSVTPDFNLWLPFPGNAGRATVFRMQFVSSGNIENVFSTLWFRRVWTTGTFREKEVELSKKIYPQVHSVILWLPIPPEAIDLVPANYECKLEKRFKRGSYAEPSFYVNLDAFN